ncbi:MAG: hypothetical protein AAGF13_05445 [Pseudomonadota bacterium]
MRRHDLFGGRSKELGMLDALLGVSKTKYRFIHAPSGFGKSALLSRWIEVLRERGQPVCYHFINRLEGMADEQFALRNLCEQLAALHGIADEMPSSIDTLRSAYAQLIGLGPPGSEPVVVVIDGLDEAQGWSPGSSLFPPSLPEDTHVYFSVRADNSIVRDEWLARLGIVEDEVDYIFLDRLQPTAIRELLHEVGGKGIALAEDQAFVKKLFDVSNGDPFYLNILVKDVGSGALTPESLYSIAPETGGLDTYLDRWKVELLEDVDIRQDEVYALLGLLTAALGPLQPMEMSRISPMLQRGALLDAELSGKLRRYLSGNRIDGYALCHPRFRDFLCNRVFNEDELAQFRVQLLAYCRNWQEHVGAYALDHFVDHLDREGHHDELFALIGSKWRMAREWQTGSPRAFVADVDAAIRLALACEPVNLREVLRCSLINGTIESWLRAMPIDMLVALVELGRIEGALDYARLFPEPERRCDTYLAITSALTEMNKTEEASQVLDLAASSAEGIADATKRAGALLRVAEAYKARGNDKSTRGIQAKITAAGMRLREPETLEAIGKFLTDAGDATAAAEFSAQASAAREQKKQEWNFNLGFDFSAIPSDAETALNENVDKACTEADRLLGEGRRIEAQEILIRAYDALDRPSGDDTPAPFKVDAWLKLSDACARAGDQSRAHGAAHSAQVNLDSLPETSFHLTRRRAQCRTEIAQSLLKLEFAEEAEGLAIRAIDEAAEDYIGGGFDAVAKLARAFLPSGFAEIAERLLEKLLLAVQHKSAHAAPSSLLAALAHRAAVIGKTQEALELCTQALAEPEFLMPNTIGVVAKTRAVVDPQCEFDTERNLIEELEPDHKAQGLAMLATVCARAGRCHEAVELVNDVVPLATPIKSGTGALALLEAARGMSVCGHHDGVAQTLESVEEYARMPNPVGSEGISIEKADVLAEAGFTEAGVDGATKALESAISCRVSDTLVELVALCQALGETARVDRLIDAACGAIEIMPDSAWMRRRTFQRTIKAAIIARDQGAISRLADVADQATDARDIMCYSSELAMARGTLGQDPVRHAARALDAVRSAKNLHPSALEDDLPLLAHALADVGDTKGLHWLCDWATTSHARHNAEALSRLLPAWGKLQDEAGLVSTLQKFVDLVSGNAPARCMLHAGAAQAYQALDDGEALRRMAREALADFDKTTDGSKTPRLLKPLVPVLVAARDKNALMQLLKSPREKWPYEHEWGPSLELILPALAELGVDEPDFHPGLKRAIENTGKRWSDIQRAIAHAQAKRGDADKAFSTANDIKLLSQRAQAFCGLARHLTQAGAREQAVAAFDKAIELSPAILNDTVLLGDMALAATALDVPKRIQNGLRLAFLSDATADFVCIEDIDKYAAAVRILCRIGNDEGIRRAEAVLGKATNTAMRSECSAAFALALAEAGNTDRALKRADETRRRSEDVQRGE